MIPPNHPPLIPGSVNCPRPLCHPDPPLSPRPHSVTPSAARGLNSLPNAIPNSEFPPPPQLPQGCQLDLRVRPAATRKIEKPSPTDTSPLPTTRPTCYSIYIPQLHHHPTPGNVPQYPQKSQQNVFHPPRLALSLSKGHVEPGKPPQKIPTPRNKSSWRPSPPSAIIKGQPLKP